MADFITVGKGDTLSKLAKLHGTTVEKLCELNGIKDPNKLQIGQKLSLGNTTEAQPQAKAAPEITPEQLAAATEKAKSDAAQTEQMIQEEGTFERAGRTLDEGFAWAGEKFKDFTEAYADTQRAEIKAYEKMGELMIEGVKAGYEFVTEDIPEAVETGVEITLGAVQEGAEWVAETAVDVYEGAVDLAKDGVELVKEGAEWVAETAVDAYEGAVDLAKDAGRGIKKGAEWVAETAVDAYEATEEFITEDIPEAVETGVEIALGAVQEGAEWVAETAVDVYEGAVDLAEDGVELVKEGAEWVAETAVDAYEGAVETGKEALAYVDNKLDQAGEAIAETYQDIKEGVKEGAQWVAQKAEDAYDGAVEAGKEAIAWVDNKVDQVGDAIDDGVRSTGRKAKNAAKGFFASLKADTPQRQDRSQALESDDTSTRLEAKGEDLIEKAQSFVGRAWNKGVEEAEDVARKGYRGLKKAWNWLTGD